MARGLKETIVFGLCCESGDQSVVWSRILIVPGPNRARNGSITTICILLRQRAVSVHFCGHPAPNGMSIGRGNPKFPPDTRVFGLLSGFPLGVLLKPRFLWQKELLRATLTPGSSLQSV